MAFPKTHHFHTTYDSPCLVALGSVNRPNRDISTKREEWWVWEWRDCHFMHKHERTGTNYTIALGRATVTTSQSKKKWWHWYCLCWIRFNPPCPSEQHCPVSLFSVPSTMSRVTPQKSKYPSPRKSFATGNMWQTFDFVMSGNITIYSSFKSWGHCLRTKVFTCIQFLSHKSLCKHSCHDSTKMTCHSAFWINSSIVWGTEQFT